MQPPHARLICRSSNSFAASIALWQHFVLPFIHPQRSAYSTVVKIEPSANLALKIDGLQSSAAPGPQHSEIQNDFSSNSRSSPTIRAVHDDSPGPPIHTATIENDLRIRRTKPKRPVTRPGRLPRSSRDTEAETDPSSPESLLLKTQNEIDKNGDYEGVLMRCRHTKPSLRVDEGNLPWALKSAERDIEGKHVVKAMERLNIEMMKFHEFVKPSGIEALARRHLIEQMRSHTREILPNHVLEVFGSERTGLALATSDIDLRLMKVSDVVRPEALVLPPSRSQRISLLDQIYRLRRKLLLEPDYKDCTVLHARYPLLSLRDRASGLDVQIVLSNDTSLSRSMIQKYIQQYPYIRQVYSVVKVMFEIRGLSDTFRGGFGSYTIFMMIVASLRHCDPKEPPKTAAEGLRVFFSFWTTFDTTTKGISIEPAEFYDKATEAPMTDKVRAQLENKELKPAPAFCLSLRDPADPTNDLGRKGLAIKHFQTTLRHLVWIFDKKMQHNNRPSLLSVFIGPVYALTFDQRKQLKNQGMKVSKSMNRRLVEKAKQIRDSNTAADISPSDRIVSDETIKLDFEPVQDSEDSMTSILGMPSADELAAYSESKAQDTEYSEKPSGTVVEEVAVKNSPDASGSPTEEEETKIEAGIQSVQFLESSPDVVEAKEVAEGSADSQISPAKSQGI